jgi:hypothetical protein
MFGTRCNSIARLLISIADEIREQHERVVMGGRNEGEEPPARLMRRNAKAADALDAPTASE